MHALQKQNSGHVHCAPDVARGATRHLFFKTQLAARDVPEQRRRRRRRRGAALLFLHANHSVRVRVTLLQPLHECLRAERTGLVLKGGHLRVQLPGKPEHLLHSKRGGGWCRRRGREREGGGGEREGDGGERGRHARWTSPLTFRWTLPMATECSIIAALEANKEMMICPRIQRTQTSMGGGEKKNHLSDHLDGWMDGRLIITISRVARVHRRSQIKRAAAQPNKKIINSGAHCSKSPRP